MKTEFNKIRKRKKERKSFDAFLFVIVIAITALGTLVVASSSHHYASVHYGDGAYYIKRQVVFLIIGLVAMITMSTVKTKTLMRLATAFYVVCMVLLVLVLVAGFSEGVAKRWLGIPGTPLSFQPSEMMKPALVLMLSRLYAKERKTSFFNEIILPGIILFGACGLVLLEKHLSGTVILAFVGLSVIFLSGTSVKKMALSYGSAGLLGGGLFLLTNSYAMKRIESFLNPDADMLSDKWQTTQGLYAIGSGGLWGLGYNNSRQKYCYVSEPQNDFIFTIWCEEMGFVGAVLLVMLFVLLVWQGYRIAFSAKDKFSSFTAFGITSQVAIQAFLNMMVVTDLIPNTGISLPFFSYGGSSLVILLAEMGILLSISKDARCKG